MRREIRNTEPVVCEGIVVYETDLAFLVEIDGDKYWLPKSHIGIDLEYPQNGDEIIVTMARWLAEAKGLA